MKNTTPFFFNFARNNGHVRATVELHHENGIVDHTTVEMPVSEFIQDCIESGVHELAGTDHPEGLAEYAYENTDLVFCHIHAIRPFTFTTQTV